MKRAIFLLLALFLAACGSVDPTDEEMLVVEAFFNTGRSLPDIIVRRTLPLSEPYRLDGTTAVSDATVHLVIDGTRTVPYHLVSAKEGRYAPDTTPEEVREGARFVVEVTRGTERASGETTAPPSILIDSVHVHVPAEPVEAILLDSLALDSTLARNGWIYPVEVSVYWKSQIPQTDSLTWIRTSLKPPTAFSSTVIDLFLRSSQILQERKVRWDPYGHKVWTGVYAVPVEHRTDPIAHHELRVALLRSGLDYARFASSRDTPERREPVTNVHGGLGIIAGISVDSLKIHIEQGTYDINRH